MSPWRREHARAEEERHLAHEDWQADDAHPLDDNGFTFEDHRRRSGRRRIAGCLVPIVLLGALGVGGWQAYRYLESYLGGQSCLLSSGGNEEKLTPEQAANAATITTVGTMRRDLPRHAAHIAITTAIQESKLRNLRGGDRDSLGLFQQRPSQGWGTVEQISDPVYSSGEFYEKLVDIDSWQTRPINDVAQDVQRSGHPLAYADHEGEGKVMSDALTGVDGAQIGCRLDAATSHSTPSEVAAKLRRQTGASAAVGGSTVTVRAADLTTARTLGAWAVAHASTDGITRVTVGDQEWVRERGREGWRWRTAERPTAATSVTISLN